MYLKRIDFENFKSFAGKISIPFMEGYTAITGPNGSGKSNIIDGMMFVMGPKSSKVLRAKKLTDMIYKGEKGGSSATYTKVTLVFDNTDRTLMVDADEVRFMRHVYFSKSSDDNYYSRFYLNDNPSSAEEFDSILTRVRISADGYNMVQQGDVADITTKGPIERRRILDGISGIADFDADLQKATAERSITQQNIDATTIVVNELTAQLSKLSKQMEDAKKALEAKEKLDMAKAQLLYREREVAEGNIKNNQELIEKNTKDITQLEEKRASCITKIADYDKFYAEVEQEIQDNLGAEYSENKSKLEELVLAKGIADDAIERLTDDNKTIGEAIEADTATFNEEKGKAESIEAEYNEKNNLLGIKKESLAKAKEEVKTINNEMTNAGGETKALTDKISKMEGAIELKSNEEHDTHSKQVTAAAQEASAKEEVANIETDIENTDFEIKDLQWSLENYKKEVGPVANISALKEKLFAIQAEENKQIEMAKDLKSAVDRLTGDYNRLMAEKKYADGASGDEAVRAVLKMRDTGALKGIYGTVSELASVDKEYETALGIAAGSRMKSIIVDNDGVAAAAIDALNKGGFGRATFLPLNKMVEGKPRAKAIMVVGKTLGYAIDLVKFKPEFRAAFWTVFADTLVTSNMNEARAIMGGVRIVTKQGELFEASGAMTGGSSKHTMNFKFGSGSQGKLDEVTKQLQAAVSSYDAVQQRLEEITNEKREIGNQITNIGAGNAEVSSKIASMEANIKILTDKRKHLDKQLGEKKEALDKASGERAALDEKLGKIVTELEGFKEDRAKMRNRLEQIAPAEINQRMNNARKAVDDFTAEINDLNNAILELKNRKFEADTTCKSLKKAIDESNEKIKANEATIKTNKDESDKLQIDVTSYRTIINEMESKVNELKERKEKISGNKIKEQNALDKAISDIDLKKGMIDSENAAIINLNMELEKLKSEIEQIKFEVKQPLPPEEELKRTIRNAESTIERLGNVNYSAIEEYDEKKARYDGLKADLAKLESEIKELERLMEEANVKKTEGFMKTYREIAESFKEIFKEISGGGEAYISLENEKDPFQGGLILNAKPKSGKMLTLASLSGGEKSLTALAFIFAIQDRQPSPFYVFDEVDMFLDPINAEIVADYVKKSSAKTQFLQITHKPNVLPKSNHLIGVTKQSNGVSRVIMEPSIDELIKQDPDMQKEVA